VPTSPSNQQKRKKYAYNPRAFAKKQLAAVKIQAPGSVDGVE
jgi:hypothetical protein